MPTEALFNILLEDLADIIKQEKKVIGLEEVKQMV